MKLLPAKETGFCRGVERALRIARSAAPVKTIGSIIHNERVVQALECEGIGPDISSARLLIPAHGLPDAEISAYREKGFELVDATCPVVAASISKIRNSSAQVVIVADAGHAETRALLGAKPGSVLVSCVSDAEKVRYKSIDVAVQTTFEDGKAAEILSVLEKNCSVNLLNTICPACLRRRKEVCELAGQADAVVVVGSATSANTRALGRLAEKCGRRVFYVTDADAVPCEVSDYETVAVVSGTSSPPEDFGRCLATLNVYSQM